MVRLMMTLDSESLNAEYARAAVEAFLHKMKGCGVMTRATIEQLGGGDIPVDLLPKKE